MYPFSSQVKESTEFTLRQDSLRILIFEALDYSHYYTHINIDVTCNRSKLKLNPFYNNLRDSTSRGCFSGLQSLHGLRRKKDEDRAFTLRLFTDSKASSLPSWLWSAQMCNPHFLFLSPLLSAFFEKWTHCELGIGQVIGSTYFQAEPTFASNQSRAKIEGSGQL